MKAADVVLRVEGDRGPQDLRLADCLTAADVETAEHEAIGWIKSLRLVHVDGRPMRSRFAYRGDSLWWFTELYLHKRGIISEAFKQIRALDALLGRKRPQAIGVRHGDATTDWLVAQAAARLRRSSAVPVPRTSGLADTARERARGAFFTWSAAASHLRGRAAPSPPPGGVTVAAFVHSAFWRAADGGDEAYVGPVLRALAARLEPGAMQLVGVGPRTNFRVRRWWHRVAEFTDPAAEDLPLTPIDAYASWAAIAGARRVWRERRANRRACGSSEALRRAATVGGYDLWPIVERELAGVCDLQFPWSARSMDEAGAALDALRPKVVVTYAEAGGWGRAIVLEARRRGIPSVGLQHGFIYRHWLNYLHEPDEMRGGPDGDDGFPRPALTLLFDRFAEEHLVQRGGFPPAALLVTGSPRLDELSAMAARLSPGDLERTRQSVGAQPGTPLVLVASKFTQLAVAWPPLLDAFRCLPDVRFVIKCHPGESAAPYARDTAALPNVTIASGTSPLAPLLVASQLIVTVHSTVAVDGMVLGVPSLVVDLPSNLTPFVEAGAMAGAGPAAELRPTLTALLYDEEWRARLARASRAFMTRYAIGTDGQAARRSADAILALAR